MTLSTFFASRRSAIVLADGFGVSQIRAALALGEKCFFRRSRRGQGGAGIIIDHLRVNMFGGEMHRQTRPFRRSADAFPDPLMNAVPCSFTIGCSHNY